MPKYDSTCISCRTMAGNPPPPGGILFATSSWSFFLHARPLLTPGQGFIVLNRHCEQISDLTFTESAELGVVMQTVNNAMMQAFNPVRVHFGLYAEEVRHIHLHVLPRVATLPAGNLSISVLTLCYQILVRLRLRSPYSPQKVEEAASKLALYFPQ